MTTPQLTLRQFDVLACLRERPEGATTGELASALQMRTRNMHQTMTGLYARELVDRTLGIQTTRWYLRREEEGA